MPTEWVSNLQPPERRRNLAEWHTNLLPPGTEFHSLPVAHHNWDGVSYTYAVPANVEWTYADGTLTGNWLVDEVTPEQDRQWITWVVNTTSGSVTMPASNVRIEPQPGRIGIDEYRAEQDRQRQEQIQAARERRERQRVEHEEMIQRSREANRRAKALLPMVLSPEERERFDQDEEIWITGSCGGRYEIQTNHYEGNVILHSERGRKIAAFCCHPRMNGGVPPWDAFVGQILALKADELGFLETANVTDYNNGWYEYLNGLRQARSSEPAA